MSKLGILIKAHRKSKKLSLAALATQVGIAKSYLSMIENHKVKNPPSKSLLDNLENALEITPGKLTQIASWQNTPEQIKTAFNQVAQLADTGKELAQWIQNATNKKNTTTKSLDQLYKSGQLEKHINQLLNHKPTNIQSNKYETPNIPNPSITNPTPLPTKQIPIINKVAAGYPADFSDHNYPAGIADDYVNCPDIQDPDAFACRVIGNSMTPNYQEGDIIVFSPQAKITSGCDCFVRIKPDHHATFKRVYFEDEETKTQQIRLQPLNPQFPAQTYHRRKIAGVYKAVRKIQIL